MPETFEEQVERAYPWIEWRKPLRMASPQGTGLACRFCIARYGLKASEIPALPQNLHDFHAHMKDFHCIPTVSHVAQNPPNPAAQGSTMPQSNLSKSQEKRIKHQKG